MKRFMLGVSFVLIGALASAASVDCSVSGLTARQTQLLAGFLVTVNEARVAEGEEPYADFPAYCSAVMFDAVKSYIDAQKRVDAEKVADAAETFGDEIAPPAHCSAASLPAGCTKNEVACFILTGDADCEP